MHGTLLWNRKQILEAPERSLDAHFKQLGKRLGHICCETILIWKNGWIRCLLRYGRLKTKILQKLQVSRNQRKTKIGRFTGWSTFLWNNGGNTRQLFKMQENTEMKLGTQSAQQYFSHQKKIPCLVSVVRYANWHIYMQMQFTLIREWAHWDNNK